MERKTSDGTGAMIVGIDEIIRIVTGKDQAIRTIGIVSPENPDGIECSVEENAKARESFIRKATALYPKVGHLESHCPGDSGTIVYNSYIIPGISKGDLIRLAAEFRQETAVFGEFREEEQSEEPEAGEYRGSRFELILTDEDREGAVMVTRDVLLTEPIDDDHWYWQADSDRFSIPFFRSKYKTQEEKRHYPISFSDAEDKEDEEEEVLDLPIEFQTGDSEDCCNDLGDFFIEKDILSAEMIMHYEKYDKRQNDKSLTELSRIINNRYITFKVKAMRKERGHKYFVEGVWTVTTAYESDSELVES